MADELRSAFGIEAELAEGTGGIFDVRVDGDLVFSKYTEHRFPDPGEVVKRIEKRKS